MAVIGRRMTVVAMAAAMGVGLLAAPTAQQVQAAPAPGPAWPARSLDPSSYNNVLASVSAVSASDAWAVGYYHNTSGIGHAVNKTLIGHWNGTAWSQVTSPNPGSNNYLLNVSAVSGRDAWAVGCTFSANGANQTLILHWNGTAWSRMNSPSPKSGDPCLHGVSAVSGRVAWAVGNTTRLGYTLILRWNGTRWSRVTSPRLRPGQNPGSAVSAVSARNVWAAGDYFTSATKVTGTFILHWNGTAWSKAKSPNPSRAGNHLDAVSAASATDAWAAGDYVTSANKVTNTLILHWNGTAWSKARSPSPSRFSLLYGVSAVSASDAWAVGAYYDNTVGTTYTLILHWNGTTWSAA